MENIPFNPRPVVDMDADGVIHVVESCFKEYEDVGVFIDLEDLDSNLKIPRSDIESLGGEFWVLENSAGSIVGLVSCAPTEDARLYELKRLYLHQDCRGGGVADKLVALVENHAQEQGATAITLWSDTRFTRAHAFYEKKGYSKQAETRDLHDLSNTTEFNFIKKL